MLHCQVCCVFKVLMIINKTLLIIVNFLCMCVCVCVKQLSLVILPHFFRQHFKRHWNDSWHPAVCSNSELLWTLRKKTKKFGHWNVNAGFHFVFICCQFMVSTHDLSKEQTARDAHNPRWRADCWATQRVTRATRGKRVREKWQDGHRLSCCGRSDRSSLSSQTKTWISVFTCSWGSFSLFCRSFTWWRL